MKNVYANFFLLIFLVFTFEIRAQTHINRLDSLFNKIKHSELALRIFFSEMPKGGDLHHHYSGSIYAEQYIEKARSLNAWINPVSLEISFELLDKSERDGWKKFKSYENQIGFYLLQQNLLKHWSVKDYARSDGITSYDDFFNTFDHFGSSKDKMKDGSGLIWLKNLAISQKVSYLETMLEIIPCGKNLKIAETFNDSLLYYYQINDSSSLINLFNTLKTIILNNENKQCIQEYLGKLREEHERLKLDDSLFTIRYLTYMIRVLPPVQVFTQMLLSYEAAQKDTLLVGVNMVAPEHNPISIRDYQLHMRMFKYCAQHWPSVSLSLHAGELSKGMVSPENLNFHIQEAVEIAGAKRIGHGTALAFEKNSLALLGKMKEKNTVLEINFNSNQFILNSTAQNHPFELYHKAKIPLVICTDDAAVLRTDHNSEYIQIALKYPYLSYADFKEFAFNSIKYSFIKGTKVKEKLNEKLEKDFHQFEEKMLKNYLLIFGE